SRVKRQTIAHEQRASKPHSSSASEGSAKMGKMARIQAWFSNEPARRWCRRPRDQGDFAAFQPERTQRSYIKTVPRQAVGAMDRFNQKLDTLNALPDNLCKECATVSASAQVDRVN